MIEFVSGIEAYIRCDICDESHENVQIYGFKDKNFRKEADICGGCVAENDDLCKF